jgi:hypothetical protein
MQHQLHAGSSHAQDMIKDKDMAFLMLCLKSLSLYFQNYN